MIADEMTLSGQPTVEAGRARLLVLHDDELVLWGCRVVFGRQAWVSRCLVAASVERAQALAERYERHLALVHVPPRQSAAQITAAVRAAHPPMRVLLIAEAGRLTDFDARAAGAIGLATSPLGAAGLLSLVRAAAAGDTPAPAADPHGAAEAVVLSARERQVLSHLATGATNREIATRLVLSPDTIKNHVSRAYRKLGARNRLEAVNRARDLGLIG